MDEKTLRRFKALRGTAEPDGTKEGQIELLVRALETAMDKIHHLEDELSILQAAAGQSTDEVRQRYVDSRMDSRFCSVGLIPRSLQKWRAYLETSFFRCSSPPARR